MSKAVFLDRDGVINEVLSKRVKFVNKPEQLFLLEGVGEGIKLLKESGYLVFVVTNQGGIGLGYMKEKMLLRVHEKMVEEIEKQGGGIDDVAYCPHKPNEGCACRKPEPEMIESLINKHQIDIDQSYMVGDRDVDIYAGKAAGLKTIIVNNKEFKEADYSFKNLYDAAVWLTTEG